VGGDGGSEIMKTTGTAYEVQGDLSVKVGGRGSRGPLWSNRVCPLRSGDLGGWNHWERNHKVCKHNFRIQKILKEKKSRKAWVLQSL